MDLPPDFKDLLEELGRDAVEFLLIGGYAVAFHGRPRATKDIDILLLGRPENLARAARAVARFGAPPHVATAIATMKPSEVVFMGQPPLRVDFLQSIDGVESRSSPSFISSRTSAPPEGLRISSTLNSSSVSARG